MRKSLLGVGFAFGLALAGASVPTVAGEQAQLKNIEVLTGMTPREVQMEMVAWNTALGVACTECHVQGDFAAETPPLKAVSREMARMVKALNEGPFFSSSDRKANCYMCHQGKKQVPTGP